MTRSTSAPGANAPPADPTPYACALAAGNLDPLMHDPASTLLEEMGTRVPANDVSLEIAALRLLLLRLLTEHHDLPSLIPLMTRVIAVAIQAARMRRSLDGQGAEELLGAVATILDEVFANQH